MQASAIVNESSSNAPAKKRAKTPVIYVSVDKVANEIKQKCLSLLIDGLSHLDAKVLSEEDLDVDAALSESNIAVLLSDNEDLLKKAWEKGVVPVTTGFNSKIQNYDPNTESGNSFVYENVNEWEVFAAVVRAIETYKFPYDWKFIVRSCMKSV